MEVTFAGSKSTPFRLQGNRLHTTIDESVPEFVQSSKCPGSTRSVCSCIRPYQSRRFIIDMQSGLTDARGPVWQSVTGPEHLCSSSQTWPDD